MDPDQWSADIAELFCAESALIRLGARLVFDVDELPLIARPLSLIPEYLPPPQDATTGQLTQTTVEARETRLQTSAAQSRAPAARRRFQYRQFELVLQFVIRNSLVRAVAESPELALALKQDIAHALAVRADHAFLRGDAAGPAPRGIALTRGVLRHAGAANDLLRATRAMITRLRTRQGTNFANAGWILHPDTLDGLSQLLTADNLVKAPVGVAGQTLDSKRLVEYDGYDGGLLLGYPFIVSDATAESIGVANTKKRIYFSSDWSEAWIGAESGLVSVDVSTEARFQTDETVIRAVMHHDFIVRRPDAFIYTDPPL